jgi:hypothetical protein
MNERIKDFIKQATLIMEVKHEGYRGKSYTEQVKVFDKEKFAELIVKECVGLIRKQSIGEEILGGQRYKTVQLGETIATITEHFGVEE